MGEVLGFSYGKRYVEKKFHFYRELLYAKTKCRLAKGEPQINLLQQKELYGAKGRTPWRLSVRGKSTLDAAVRGIQS